ncbi:uncharacterized protein SCODWIG_02668 [Saccharomycodes ludwigii]|uniref:DNA replication regulator Sld3 C-terminal domain-containing protein n=1 Tax=Saccharomycodes ludwigii TaxID=36035 RepID=A0A376B8C7_9ASCO|nr:uncharacterized protein SCODWIG_02668 [Saccharomycodes ludwigii]
MTVKLKILQSFNLTSKSFLLVAKYTISKLKLHRDQILILSSESVLPCNISDDITIKYLVQEIETDKIYVLESLTNKVVILYQLPKDFIDKLDNKESKENSSKNVQDLSFNNDFLTVSNIPDILKKIKETNKPCSRERLGNTHDSVPILLNQVSFYKPRLLASNSHMNNGGNNSTRTGLIDPEKYLLEKYHEVLYSINLTFSHFIRHCLYRFKKLCKESCEDLTAATLKYKKILTSMLLSVNQFDKRHFNNGLLKNIDTADVHLIKLKNKILLSDWKIQDLNSFTDNNDNCEIISKLNSIFKIRELKLQILLTLELLLFTSLDSRFEKFQSVYKKNIQKRALHISKLSIKKRKKKENLKTESTKYGVKNDDMQISESTDLCEKLDIWLDKLIITESLITINYEITNPMEKRILDFFKGRMLVDTDEESTFGFLNKLLIPYYKKKLPHTTKFISKKVKGTTFKNSLTAPTSKDSLQKSNDNTTSIDGSTQLMINRSRSNSILSSTSGANSTDNNNRKVGSLFNAPFLNRKSSTLSDFISMEPNKKPQFKRTKSELYNLERRLTSIIGSTKESTNNNTLKSKKRKIMPTLYRESNKVPQEPDTEGFMKVNGKMVKLAKLSSHFSSFQRIGKKVKSNNSSNADLLESKTGICSTTEPKMNVVEVEATPLKKYNSTNQNILLSTQRVSESPLVEFASTRNSPLDQMISSCESKLKTPLQNLNENTEDDDSIGRNLMNVRRKLFK